MGRDKIILSAKVSNVQDLVSVYEMLAARCDYALHVGLTEAGIGSKGIVATSAALAVLLQQGIGDTIRASLTPLPNGDRSEEVIVSQQILQALNLRSFTPQVAACPGCGRTTSTSSRIWPTRFRPICASRCWFGAKIPGRGRNEGSRDGLRGEWAGNQSMPTLASLCLGRLRRRSRRLCGWQAFDDVAGRSYCGGVPRYFGSICQPEVWE